MSTILEGRDVERPAKSYAKKRGWWTAKFVSPGLRGVPDDVFIRNGVVLFVEFKSDESKEATPQQKKRHREMIAAGANVHVVRTLKEAYALFR